MSSKKTGFWDKDGEKVFRELPVSDKGRTMVLSVTCRPLRRLHGFTQGLTLHTANIHKKNLQLLMTDMHKTKNGLNPSFMRELFYKNATHNNLRNNNEFVQPREKSASNGKESVRLKGQQLWQMLLPTYPGYQSLIKILWYPGYHQRFEIRNHFVSLKKDQKLVRGKLFMQIIPNFCSDIGLSAFTLYIFDGM